MNIAFCYEQVIPARGGCETYITDLARRMLAERHEVHLYASRWDEQALPKGIVYHAIPQVKGPRFLRPWRFAALCEKALRCNRHDVSIGFNKTWGQNVLYPQGGLHAASFDHNLNKYPSAWMRKLVALARRFDVAHLSFSKLERKQYLSKPRPLIIVNSYMVRNHFQRYYNFLPEDVFIVRSAIDPQRFSERDRPRRRMQWRQKWNLDAGETVGLFAAMNYRLKGLVPLLHAVKRLGELPEYRDTAGRFRLLIVGNPKFAAYQKLANRLGVSERVRFVGHCPDMRNAYFASDMLIHPTFYDPCSLVVLEAFACSLPVVTTRANGASELMHPLQEGYVIDDAHDHDRLAWGIGQLLDVERRQHCAQAARLAAMRWTFDHHYRALMQVLQQAAERKQAA